ncbi:peptidase [Parasphingorhabdus cellanae]|uniref:Peptidase n=1 Tax=Parasphingorhabdus cellanae TaxID=2806553 RepID=A0ABX7T5K3_9SPHN|nr:peptidase [Parasphingorhabdus cellanae]QTD56873.1 peptidase [Parasphingorhabdus cellanae]
MTYCVGLRLDKGLVFMSDTRTNAGVDDIAQVKKMNSWEVPGERVITLLSAGNLATTQAVVSVLDERTKAPKDRDPSILTAPSMFQVATIVGDTLRELVQAHTEAGPASESVFGATLIVGGQIKGMEPRLFLIYPEGNFIEAGDDNPFFQSGETKYGRPILVRALKPDMSFEQAVKLLCVSFDSTISANAGVDLPIDLQVYETDSYAITEQRRIEKDDPYFNEISKGWSEALDIAFATLPDFEF